MSAPDHGTECSRADAALRSLAHARSSLLEASRAFGDIGDGEPEQGGAVGAQVRIAAILDRLDAMAVRERARRDAAELAARAGEEASHV